MRKKYIYRVLGLMLLVVMVFTSTIPVFAEKSAL